MTETFHLDDTDGDLHIDNNVCEPTLKLIGVGRLNLLFVGGDNGDRTAAVLFNFTATWKFLGIDSFTCMRDVLGRLPTHPEERLEELLPHRWQALRVTPLSRRWGGRTVRMPGCGSPDGKK